MERQLKRERIKDLRKDLSLKYVDIEAKTGFKTFSIQNKEKYGNVKIEDFIKICNGLHLPVCYFITDAHDTQGFYKGEWKDVTFDYDKFKEDVINSRENQQSIRISLGLTQSSYKKRFGTDDYFLLIHEICNICNILNLELADYLHDPNIPLTPAEGAKPQSIHTEKAHVIENPSAQCLSLQPRNHTINTHDMRDKELQRYMTYIEAEAKHLLTLVENTKAIINVRQECDENHNSHKEDGMMAAEDDNTIYDK